MKTKKHALPSSIPDSSFHCKISCHFDDIENQTELSSFKLINAARTGNVTEVNSLLHLPACLPSFLDYEAIRIAAKNEHADVVKILIPHCLATKEGKRILQKTLYDSITRNSWDIVKTLLSSTATVKNYYWVIAAAATNKRDDIVKLFLNHDGGHIKKAFWYLVKKKRDFPGADILSEFLSLHTLSKVTRESLKKMPKTASWLIAGQIEKAIPCQNIRGTRPRI